MPSGVITIPFGNLKSLATTRARPSGSTQAITQVSTGLFAGKRGFGSPWEKRISFIVMLRELVGRGQNSTSMPLAFATARTASKTFAWFQGASAASLRNSR